jgi:peroxiredoxin
MKRQIAVYVLLVCSVAINVALAYRLNQFNKRFGAAKVDSLKSGVSVLPFQVRDRDGQSQMLTYDAVSTPTVLYVFTPPCSWCARNMDNFKTLVGKAGAQYRFVGLSLSDQGLPEYVAKNELQLPVYSGLSDETKKAYKFGGTPQTLVISPEGKVLQNWMGAYVGPQKSEVETFFHVSLPGLKQDAKPTATATTN